MASSLSYSVVTPARDEAENLPRLADALARQTVRPNQWVIVDGGSTDETRTIADGLAARHDWIAVHAVGGSAQPVRGQDSLAFQAGLETLHREQDIVVKLDADVSFDPDYFERLLGAFADDPTLGMASGAGHELVDGRWTLRNVTGTSVWGASRAYRWSCLEDVLPLEVRVGWDGVDEIRANAKGWRTETIRDLPFRHHRREGARERSRWAAGAAAGRASHYMGYSPLYLALRAFHRAQREPGALAMLWGYAAAALSRQPRIADNAARAYLRRQQSLRNLPARRREATRRPTALVDPAAPFFSVVTVCLNPGDGLALTLDSLEQQSSKDFEHIAVDGGSTDGALELLDSRRDLVDTLVSEPDDGIYDAMNKGLSRACGSYVYFLNAGDELAAPDVLERVRRAIVETGKPDLVYGDVFMVDEGRRRLVRYPRLSARFLFGATPCHQALFARRDLFERTGPFAVDLPLLADFDWVLRATYGAGARVHQLRLPLAVYELGGRSSADPEAIATGRRSILAARMPRGRRVLLTLTRPLADPVRGKLMRLRRTIDGSRARDLRQYDDVIWY